MPLARALVRRFHMRRRLAGASRAVERVRRCVQTADPRAPPAFSRRAQGTRPPARAITAKPSALTDEANAPASCLHSLPFLFIPPLRSTTGLVSLRPGSEFASCECLAWFFGRTGDATVL